MDKVSGDPRVSAVCKLLAARRVTPNVAQAAAWHFTDELSWTELAVKNRVESAYTGNIRFFSLIELRQAMVVAAEAERVSEEQESDKNYYAEN